MGCEVDGVCEDDPGGAARVRAREGHGEAADNKRFVETLEVGFVGFAGNGFKHLTCRRKDSGNIREVGHGCIRGEERGAVTSELLLSIDNLANYIEEQHTCCR